MADIMSRLPHHVLERIFVYTTFKDLIRCSMVCKRWRSLLSDEDSVIWRAKFEDSGTRQFRNSKHLSELMSFRLKALAYECAWNKEDASKNIYIKDDCLTLHRNPVAQSSDGIRGKTGFIRGQHYFIIIFQGPSFGSAALVGVCTKEAPTRRDGYIPLLGETEYGWAWDLSQNKLKHNGEIIQDSIEVSFNFVPPM